MRNETEKRNSACTVMALMIPTVEAAVSRNWLIVVMEAAAAWLICCWIPRNEKELPYWLDRLQYAVGILLTGWLLGWTAKPWRGEFAEYVVPAVLMILATVSLWKGKAKAQTAVSVLRYGIYGVMILLLAAGIKNIRWEKLHPRADLPDPALMTILLLPLMEKGERQNSRVTTLAMATILASIVGMGSANIYEYSRGVSVPGLADHLESLAAAAVTAGYFGMITYLLMHFGRSEKKNLIIKAATSYVFFCIGNIVPIWIYAAALLILWGIMPLLCGKKEKRRKNEKSA